MLLAQLGNACGVVKPSGWVRFGPLSKLGIEFAGSTETTKLDDALRLPSLAVSVMIALPVCSKAGVKVMVWFTPKLSTTMPEGGKSVGLSEVAVTSSEDGVSGSPTVKAIGLDDVPSSMEKSPTVEIVGCSLTFVA